MTDTFTETTTSTYGGRLGKGIKAFGAGIILIVGAIGLLARNEYRTIQRTKTLKEGQKIVVEGQITSIDKTLDGKLVHVIGNTDVKGTLIDEDFGIKTNELKLRRKVEMYQREQTTHEEKNGNETTTTYEYDKTRNEKPINSDNFKYSNGHKNPKNWKYKSKETTQDPINLGKFKLTDDFVSQLDKYEDINIKEQKTGLKIKGIINTTGSSESNEKPFISSVYIYFGDNPDTPQVGDLRVSFQYSPKSEISIIGKQDGTSLNTYITTNDGTISLLEYGHKDSAQMFQKAHSDNIMLAWLLRAVGLVMMFIGFKKLFEFIVSLGSFIPFLPDILDFGSSIASFVLTFVIGIGTIAIAWLVVRPLIGISMLLVIGGVLFLVVKKNRSKKSKNKIKNETDKILNED